MTTLHDKFQAVRHDMNSVLFERSSTIDLALLALLTGQHFLQLGAPGIAKSYLVDQLTARITGAQQFKILLNPSTTPDEVFGPIDLIELADHGKYTRRRTGSITEAHISWCDETYKSNSVVLNGLLKIINERELTEIGMPAVRVPLISFFGASNETPTDSSLDAFDDRFLLREIVQEISDDTVFIQMLTAKERPPQAFLSLADIQAAQAEAAQVKGTAEVLQKIVDLRHACSAEGVHPSQRRWKWSLDLIKAAAWLDGLPEADVESMTCLAHVLWRDPKERAVSQRLVYAATCPLYLRALDIEDQMAEIVQKVPADDHTDFVPYAESALQQIVDAHQALKGDIAVSSARNLEKPKASLAKVAGYHKQIRERLFRSVTRLELAL